MSNGDKGPTGSRERRRRVEALEHRLCTSHIQSKLNISFPQTFLLDKHTFSGPTIRNSRSKLGGICGEGSRSCGVFPRKTQLQELTALGWDEEEEEDRLPVLEAENVKHKKSQMTGMGRVRTELVSRLLRRTKHVVLEDVTRDSCPKRDKEGSVFRCHAGVGFFPSGVEIGLHKDCATEGVLLHEIGQSSSPLCFTLRQLRGRRECGKTLNGAGHKI